MADPDKTKSLKVSRGHTQKVTEEDGVQIIGAWTRGFTKADIEGFVKNPADRQGMSLLSQWNPIYEAGVDIERGPSLGIS